MLLWWVAKEIPVPELIQTNGGVIGIKSSDELRKDHDSVGKQKPNKVTWAKEKARTMRHQS